MNQKTTYRCFISPLSECGYLPDRSQRHLIVDPSEALDGGSYEALTVQSFRRNGNTLYRPQCPDCDACTPIRINLAQFNPTRSNRRNLKQNADLDIALEDTSADSEYFDLFIRYINQRHHKSSMGNMSEDDYRGFLFCEWLPTRLFTTRLNGQLMSATLIDLMPNGVSAVYTFYEPDQAHRGLGTFAILKLVERCKAWGLHYLNLGYWIDGSPTMQYKTNFKGIELAIDNRWKPHEKQI